MMKRLINTLCCSNGEIDWLKIFVLVLVVVVTVPTVLTAWWVWIDDNPPAEIMNIELFGVDDPDTPQETITVPQGGEFLVGMEWCKYTDATVEVRKTWVDDLVFPEPPIYPANARPACFDVVIPQTVPETLPPSSYHVLYSFVYEINPLVTRAVTFEVGELVVVEGIE